LIRSMLALLALLSAPAMAGEGQYGSHPPTLQYWWCEGSSTSYATNPAIVTYYMSDVFANDYARTNMSQRELNAAYWKFVVAKYGVPASSGGGSCLAGPSTNYMNDAKSNRLHELTVNKTTKIIETGWSSG